LSLEGELGELGDDGDVGLVVDASEEGDEFEYDVLEYILEELGEVGL